MKAVYFAPRRFALRSLPATLSRSFTSKPKSTSSSASTTKPSKGCSEAIESEIKDYYSNAAHYQQIWGSRMHIGYYDHVANPGNPRTKWDEAVVALTHRMCDTSGVNKDSRVLDFGCGVGENSFDIADSYGCELSAGIDITGDYIVRANVEAKSRGFGSQCVFFAGSILDLPESVYGYAPYTHVLSQECIYHVAAHFEEAVVSAGAVLETGGVFANCDFFRSDSGPDDKALGHFYKRLKLDYLVSMTECCEVLTSNGFEIVSVEDWSGHAVEGYKELEAAAKQAGVISDDGVPLAEHYNETWHAFERRSLLMPYVIARKR